jgi:exodeoxyribonuclease VII small subunit
MADPDRINPAQDADSLSFEEAFQRLGKTVEALETGGLTLAEATARYEEGMGLVRRCNQLLDEAQLKVTLLKDAYLTPTDTLDWDEEETLPGSPISEDIPPDPLFSKGG